jgi:hypothetical protein
MLDNHVHWRWLETPQGDKKTSLEFGQFEMVQEVIPKLSSQCRFHPNLNTPDRNWGGE